MRVRFSSDTGLSTILFRSGYGDKKVAYLLIVKCQSGVRPQCIACAQNMEGKDMSSVYVFIKPLASPTRELKIHLIKCMFLLIILTNNSMVEKPGLELLARSVTG